MKVVFLVLAFLIATVSDGYAAPRYTRAKQAAEQVKRAKKDLARKMKSLTDSEKAKLKSQFRGIDSDGDGVSNEIEEGIGSNLCSADSDNDGIDDSTDDHEDDADENDDGQPDGSDGQEVEAKGAIESFTDPVLVVAGKSFTITNETFFRGIGFDKEDLQAGVCVEVEGRIVSGNNVATKIKREKDC